MKAVLLKNVKKGEYFLFNANAKTNEDGEVLPKYVYVKGEYERSEKKYEYYKFLDCNDYKYAKGDRIVYIDFFF